MNLNSIPIDKPLISIIVPVYNVECYLNQCLDSLIQQTYKNIEIICINDGSTDSSAEILSCYQSKDSRVKVITTSNHGQAHARNIGINLAKGKFITFVDSDDWLDNNALELCLTLLDCEKSDFICFGIEQIKNGVHIPFKKYNKLECNRPVNASLAIRLSPEVAAKLYNTSFIKRNKIYFPEGLIYEDATFYWACISFAKSTSLINHCLYNYRIRDDSTMGKSKNRTKNFAVQHIYNLRNIYHIWKNNNFLDKNVKLFVFILESYIQQSYKFLHKDDYIQFKEELIRLCKETNIRPPIFSLTNYIIKNKRPIKNLYLISRSIQKRLL